MNNPFTSQIYELTWLKYFSKGKESKAFNFIDGLKFYKHKFFPYYINVGRNFTNGITYHLDHNARDFRKKTLLIYDVPNYININPPVHGSLIKLLRIRQYKGYLANFDDVIDFDDYLQKNLTKGSRSKYRGSIRKFENCFNVDYKIYKDFISKEQYNSELNDFKGIIVRRFETLKIHTNLINEWPFYTELIYKMILDEKAILVSIRANGNPVAMSLAFLSKNSLIGAIKAFDTDYYKFNVGHIEISKLIEFCLQNNLEYFDFSKGTYDYKNRWTNSEYDYNCHILYDSSSFYSRLTAKILARFFRLKQYLRDKNINLFFVKLKYKLKHLITKPNNAKGYEISVMDNLEIDKDFQAVNLYDEVVNFPFLKRVVFDNLFRKPEPFTNLNIFKSNSVKPVYYVIGEKSKYAIKIK